MAANIPKRKSNVVEGITMGKGVQNKGDAQKAIKHQDNALGKLYAQIEQANKLAKEVQKVVVGATMMGAKPTGLTSVNLTAKEVSALQKTIDNLCVATNNAKNIAKATTGVTTQPSSDKEQTGPKFGSRSSGGK